MTCLCLVFVALSLLIPVESKVNSTFPAIIINMSNLQEKTKKITVEGSWSSAITKTSRQNFKGNICIYALDYTSAETGWVLDFEVNEEPSTEILSGGFFYNYNSDSPAPAYGWLYTNREHNKYVIVTNKFDSQSKNYIVIAPAETVGDAWQVCDTMGVHVPTSDESYSS